MNSHDEMPDGITAILLITLCIALFIVAAPVQWFQNLIKRKKD